MPDITYYDILQVRPNATDDMIRSAYRRLVKRHHPDANPMNPALAAARFRAVQDAYRELHDPVKRRAYDQMLKMKAWNTAHNANDNQDAVMSDMFTSARRTLERLMRLMAGVSGRTIHMSPPRGTHGKEML